MIELDEFVSALQAIEVIFFYLSYFFFFGARVYLSQITRLLDLSVTVILHSISGLNISL